MPRGRIPTARCFTSTDALVLPFLAPRAFAESPVYKDAPRWGTRRPQKGKENRASAPKDKKEHSIIAFQRSKTPRNTGSTSDTRHAKGQSLLTSTLPSSFSVQTTRRTPSASTPLELRYTFISQIVRQQVRNYATEQSIKERSHVDPTERITISTPLRRTKQKETQQALNKYLRTSPYVLCDPERYGTYRTYRRKILNYARPKVMVFDLNQHRHLERRILYLGFAALDRKKIYPELKRLTYPISIMHDSQCKNQSEYFLDDATSKEEILGAWKQMGDENARTIYLKLLFYLLDTAPEKALKFLRINDFPILHFPAVMADALGYLSRFYLQEEGNADKSEFLACFIQIFDHHLRHYCHICSQDLLFSVAKLTSTEELKDIYDLLTYNNVEFDQNTLLQYANIFAGGGDYESALSLLQRIVKTPNASIKNVTKSKRFRWTCAAILRKSVVHGTNYHATSQIVAEFMKLQIPLGLLLYNCIISNAMSALDFKTAFNVFNLLESNDVKPDVFTLSILLRGCSRGTNPMVFSRFAEHCRHVALEDGYNYLAGDYLYYLLVAYTTENFTLHDVSHTLHEAYSCFYRPDLLLALGAWHSDDPTLGNKEPRFMEHDFYALFVMIVIKIRLSAQTGVDSLWNFYSHFRDYIKRNKTPAIAQLSSSPHIFNIFLFGFCQQRQFASASQLITEMTDGPLPNPDVVTWTVFMQALAKQGHTRTAERILTVMGDRGVMPDRVTWHLLLKHYAITQNIDKVAYVMEQIDQAQELDDKTLHALSRVQDQERLKIALDEVRGIKEDNMRRETEMTKSQKRREMKQLKLALEEAKGLKDKPVAHEEELETHLTNGLQE